MHSPQLQGLSDPAVRSSGSSGATKPRLGAFYRAELLQVIQALHAVSRDKPSFPARSPGSRLCHTLTWKTASIDLPRREPAVLLFRVEGEEGSCRLPEGWDSPSHCQPSLARLESDRAVLVQDQDGSVQPCRPHSRPSTRPCQLFSIPSLHAMPTIGFATIGMQSPETNLRTQEDFALVNATDYVPSAPI